jgi:hypothetical protein
MPPKVGDDSNETCLNAQVAQAASQGTGVVSVHNADNEMCLLFTSTLLSPRTATPPIHRFRSVL